MSAVDVTYAIADGIVTSVDTGMPVGAFPADGTQTDPIDNAPFPVGTIIQNDPNGFPAPVTTNESTSPPITVNSTQTWKVQEETLYRNSLIFNKPTKFGKFHEAIDWMPVNQISVLWGKLQIIIGGKDVTYFRGHPSQIGSWVSNEPNGDVSTSMFFPQISWFEEPGIGELSWMSGAKDLDIILIRPNGTRKTLFEGLVVGRALDGQGMGWTLNAIGCLYQADHTPYIQELYQSNRDIGTAIANIMDNTISRHFLPCNKPVTGIKTNIRGSGGARLTQGVQDVLATAFIANATNQWTITNYPGRKPVVKLKDRTTHHWTMAMAHPGLTLSLTDDFQQSINMIWGSGTTDTGGVWYNTKYPGIRIENAPIYPLAVGAVFSPGSGSHGFDAFADELRTRGYRMASGDTYSSSDVDEVRDAQRRAGITIDGVVGGQTWNAIFGVGGAIPLNAHISPLAAATWTIQNLERVDGSIIGRNSKYDKQQLAVGRLVEYGQGVTKKQGVTYATGEIQAAIRHDPQWVGSATLSMDPENGSRWEMRAGENIFFKYMRPAPARRGKDDGLLLHISQVTVTPGGSVSLQLSYLAHDMTTLAAIAKRNKDTLDPARRTTTSTRASKVTNDKVIPWDDEAGAGAIQMHNLQGGFWTVFAIPAGQIGSITNTQYICASGINSNAIATAFDQDGALDGAKPFCVAIFGRPVTSNYMQNTIGNPFSSTGVWSRKAASLHNAGLLQAYGESGQAAGYWPGQGSEGGEVTGKMQDGQSWPFTSYRPPYLWIAEYCQSSTRASGQLRNGIGG